MTLSVKQGLIKEAVTESISGRLSFEDAIWAIWAVVFEKSPDEEDVAWAERMLASQQADSATKGGNHYGLSCRMCDRSWDDCTCPEPLI